MASLEDKQISVKDVIQLIGGILALVGLYIALKVTDVSMQKDIDSNAKEIQDLEEKEDQRHEWIVRELELLR